LKIHTLRTNQDSATAILVFLIALNDGRSEILWIILEIILFLFITEKYRLEIFYVFGFSGDFSDAVHPLVFVGVSLERQIPERFAFQGVF
jgi:hypothetical protein